MPIITCGTLGCAVSRLSNSIAVASTLAAGALSSVAPSDLTEVNRSRNPKDASNVPGRGSGYIDDNPDSLLVNEWLTWIVQPAGRMDMNIRWAFAIPKADRHRNHQVRFLLHRWSVVKVNPTLQHRIDSSLSWLASPTLPLPQLEFLQVGCHKRHKNWLPIY